MTTLMPSRSDAHSYDTLDDERLATALHPWHNRLVLQYVLRWLVGGVLVGMALAGLVLIIARLTPWAAAPSWAGGLILAFALAAPVIALWLRPSTEGTAHIVDSKLQLQDRISTAWEMRDQKATLAVLQRRDALQQLKQYAPTTTIDLRPGRSTLIALAVVIMALVLLIVLPNPMNDVLRQQEAFQTKVAQQVKAITKVRQDLVHQPDLPQTQQQVDQILSDLQAKLQQARNENEAQQAIADAQAKLNQLRDPQATNKIQGQAAAGSSLQGSSNKNLQSAGQALSNNNSKALAQALQDLVNQAGKLSAAQRSQLSQQIEQAANQANQNPNLSSALHQLAKSLADGNQSEINDAANAVNAAAQQDASTQAQEQGIGKASQNLQQSANALASSTDSSTSKQQGQQGQQGQGQNQGQGQQGQQGQGQNQGQGQQGQQGQNGRGQNQGQGPGQGQGQQGGQGKGGQGGSNGAGSQQGKTEQVYVPGQTGSGASTQSNDNTSGVVQQGSSVPYSQVVQQYNQQAHDAIDNSNAPPDVKDLVHNYFDALEGQQ